MTVSIADVVRRMLAAGAPGEAITVALEAIEQVQQEHAAAEEAAKEKRARNATRMRNARARTVQAHNAHSASTNGAQEEHGARTSSSPLVPPPSPLETPSSPLNPPSSTFSCGRGATRTHVDPVFEKFWETYPKREGANPKQPAAKKFLAALKAGAAGAEILAGAAGYRAECDANKLTGTPHVAMAVTWLNQQRWSDYANGAQAPPGQLAEERPGRPHGMPISAWNKFGQHWTPETPGNVRPDQWETWKREHANGQAGQHPAASLADGSAGMGQAQR